MRVVAGIAGGIPLMVPAGITRPTMDKVRAAIFSSLGNAVIDARVLDLFAGSGAFGIEALSRGAAHAVFIDNHRAAANAIRSNLTRTRLSGDVVNRDAFAYLHADSAPPPFDLVFADPPYHKNPADTDFATRLIMDPGLPRLLAERGTLVLETEVKFRGMESLSDEWRVLRTKSYGDTAVHFLTHA